MRLQIRPMVPVASIPNPFVSRSVVTDPRRFVGRREQLRTIATYVSQPSLTSLNIVGGRRLGKSSLLYHFSQTWEQWVTNPNRYAVIYLSFQEMGKQTEAELYQAIAYELLNCPAICTDLVLKRLFNVPRFTRQSFATALAQCRIEDVIPVFCLDDFDVLLQSRHCRRLFGEGFYDSLKTLVKYGTLALVLTSTADLKEYSDRHNLTSRFFERSRVIYLNGLTDADVAELVALPASTIPGTAALTLDDQKRARRWGQRHPYLLQLAAWYLCEAQRHSRHISWAKSCFIREARRLPQLQPSRRHWWLRLHQSPTLLPAYIKRSLSRHLTPTQILAGLTTLLLIVAAALSATQRREVPEITDLLEQMSRAISSTKLKS